MTTNLEIIMMETIELIETGKIKPNEEIHTFAKWKALGYSIKAGEKAIARFSIWKCKYKTITDEDGSQYDKRSMFLKESCFFSTNQVIKAGN